MAEPKFNTADDPALTSREAADLLGVSVSTAQGWMENGSLESWKTPGGHRRTRRSSVLGLLAETGHSIFQPTVALRAAPPAAWPSVPNYDEPARLQAVARSGLLNTPADPSFDRITSLATQIFDAPIALITLLTEKVQWFKSHQGVDVTETPREWAFCSHAIQQDDLFIVPDTREDERFIDNPLVTSAPYIRFYASYPLRDAYGYALGTLCVIDREPRQLRNKEMRALRELGGIATDLLRLRALEAAQG